MKDLLEPSELLRMIRCLYVRGILTEAERRRALVRLARRCGTKLTPAKKTARS